MAGPLLVWVNIRRISFVLTSGLKPPGAIVWYLPVFVISAHELRGSLHGLLRAAYNLPCSRSLSGDRPNEGNVFFLKRGLGVDDGPRGGACWPLPLSCEVTCSILHEIGGGTKSLDYLLPIRGRRDLVQL